MDVLSLAGGAACRGRCKHTVQPIRRRSFTHDLRTLILAFTILILPTFLSCVTVVNKRLQFPPKLCKYTDFLTVCSFVYER